MELSLKGNKMALFEMQKVAFPELTKIVLIKFVMQC